MVIISDLTIYLNQTLHYEIFYLSNALFSAIKSDVIANMVNKKIERNVQKHTQNAEITGGKVRHAALRPNVDQFQCLVF